MSGDYDTRGWARFAADPRLAPWVRAARGQGLAALADPALARWYQCERTWFVGVDALDNDGAGAVAGVAPRAAAIDALVARYGQFPALHRAQLSVVFPGYPRPREGESAAAFGYRRDRDAAHVDGVMGSGSPKRRRMRETHAWILGLPLNAVDPDAAPLVAWEGSHRIIADALRAAVRGYDPACWGDIDVTEAYHAARRRVFETCRRVALAAVPGEAIVLHRHTLHGVAPWAAPDTADAPEKGRMIAYFRPPHPGGVAEWLLG
ncbi:MAG: hypothetical protein NXH82_16680 [Rhodobacteraceae bacterium]|nr:hypothetical protein [Paracoccaceae bacterium]